VSTDATGRAVGDLKVSDNVVYRWDGTTWQAVPLADEPPAYAVQRPGVWYLSRDMRRIVHLEEDALRLDSALFGVEREVARTLLRCALQRLEGTDA
jgi:hypothetical protein